MAGGKVRRKLTAIFSADVKGYSRLMGEDEVATIRTLEQYRKIMAGHIQKHAGRVVDGARAPRASEISPGPSQSHQ